MSERNSSVVRSIERISSGKRSPATDAEIEAALDYLAYLIDKYGDQFWPVFDTLDRELEARRSRAARLSARLNRNHISVANTAQYTNQI